MPRIHHIQLTYIGKVPNNGHNSAVSAFAGFATSSRRPRTPPYDCGL